MKLHVDKLVLQKDEFRVNTTKVLDSHEFSLDPAKSALVEDFKRFVIDARVEGDGGIWEIKIIIDLRGNIVTCTAPRDCPYSPWEILNGLSAYTARWDYETLQRSGQGAIIPPLMAITGPQKRPARAVAKDGFWLAAILHHIRDDKGASLQYTKAPPIRPRS